MKITENLIDKVHKLANQKLRQDFPILDMADKPEGSIKWWMVKYILEAYNEAKKGRSPKSFPIRNGGVG